MNKKQIDVLTRRYTIINNIDRLINYGKKYQKNNSSNQLSLFNNDTVILDRIELNCNKPSENELVDLSFKESSVIGFMLTYDVYSEYSLIEKVLKTISLNDIIMCSNNNEKMNFIAYVDKIEEYTSQLKNRYAKISFKKGNVNQYMYLFGKNYKENINNIYTGNIYIIRCLYKNSSYSILKIQDCKGLDVKKYIKKVSIVVNNINNLEKVNNYIFAKMKNKGNFTLEFIVLDTKYPMKYKVNISNENINYLSTIGADILINKK